MARRKVKTTQQLNEAQDRSISGIDGQAQEPSREELLGNDASAHKDNRSLPSDTRTRIEKLAYQLYEQRGCRHGDDWKDWLEAERMTVRRDAG
jgi:hypothetical protein